jgi:hypothetical protein
MKKLIYVFLSFGLIISLFGCSSKSDLTLTDFADSFEEAGYEVDLLEKPLYGLINAIDGFIFYIDGNKVAIYEYESKRDLEDSEFTFDSINERFGLESSSTIAKDIFDSVGN